MKMPEGVKPLKKGDKVKITVEMKAVEMKGAGARHGAEETSETENRTDQASNGED